MNIFVIIDQAEAVWILYRGSDVRRTRVSSGKAEALMFMSH